jgi:hypothetical protein
MNKKNRTSLLSLLFLLIGNLMVFAQFEGPDPDPPPEGLGAPASPVDMYIYVLLFVAFLLIVHSKKMKQKKIA